MRSLGWILPMAAVVALAAPTDLWAQGRGRGHGKHKDKHEARFERRDRDRDRVFIRERGNGEVVLEVRDRDDDRRGWLRGRQVVRARDLDDFDDDDVIVLRDRNGRIILVDRDDIEDRFRFGRVNRRGHGPAFCRSGAGHPVHGRRWCIEKGWGLGSGVFFDDGRAILDRDRVIFRAGDEVLIARARRDRSTIERMVDRILFWAD